jgi:hypothetical protein
MLFDNGLFWLIIIILTVAGSVLIGIYNREEDNDSKTLLIIGWVIIGIDLVIFAYALFQAFTLKSASKRLLTDIKQNY